MKASDAYSSSYCSVAQWPTVPSEHTITEAGIDDDRFATAKDARIVYVCLDTNEIRYRVNKTNTDTLVKVFGDDLKDWIGRSVSIQRVQATIKGQRGWAGIVEPLETAPKKAKK